MKMGEDGAALPMKKRNLEPISKKTRAQKCAVRGTGNCMCQPRGRGWFHNDAFEASTIC
jgi:hypothetical protein